MNNMLILHYCYSLRRRTVVAIHRYNAHFLNPRGPHVHFTIKLFVEDLVWKHCQVEFIHQPNSQTNGLPVKCNAGSDIRSLVVRQAVIIIPRCSTRRWIRLSWLDANECESQELLNNAPL